MEKVTELTARLAEPVIAEQGCTLWDVEYVKEAGTWYLRVLIDKEGGVDILDCEAISRKLSDLLDEADPIEGSYTLEVGSAGAERALKRPADFQRYLNSPVLVKLYKPVDGRKGVIVNVSSCSSVVSSTNRGEYCVSKAGVSMLTTLYADRLAAEGILVNEVRPGVIATDMTSKVQSKYDSLIENGTFPIARWGTPEDVAGAVSLLCSDRLRYTTGNYLDVDGGFHIQRL